MVNQIIDVIAQKSPTAKFNHKNHLLRQIKEYYQKQDKAFSASANQFCTFVAQCLFEFTKIDSAISPQIAATFASRSHIEQWNIEPFSNYINYCRNHETRKTSFNDTTSRKLESSKGEIDEVPN